jgi:hypothetical protein
MPPRPLSFVSWCAALLGLASLAVSFSARAEPSAEERAVAADLFQTAVTAEDRGDWTACESALADAVGIVETPGLRYHLAYCKEQQKRWVEALVDYRRAEEMMNQGVEADDVAALLPETIRRLQAVLPRLTLELSPVPEETTLAIDGKELSPQLFGKPLPLDPGNRRIEVRAPGYEPFSSELSLLPSERRSLEIVLVQEAQPAKPKALNPTEPESRVRHGKAWLSPKGWVMVSEAAVSAAALGIGVSFSVEAGKREGDRRKLIGVIDDPSACAGSSPDDRCGLLQQAIRESDDARTFATAAYVTSAVGVAALIGTWMLWPTSSDTAVGVASDGVATLVSVTRNF